MARAEHVERSMVEKMGEGWEEFPSDDQWDTEARRFPDKVRSILAENKLVRPA
jgi:hypothetical protein